MCRHIEDGFFSRAIRKPPRNVTPDETSCTRPTMIISDVIITHSVPSSRYVRAAAATYSVDQILWSAGSKIRFLQVFRARQNYYYYSFYYRRPPWDNICDYLVCFFVSPVSFWSDRFGTRAKEPSNDCPLFFSVSSTVPRTESQRQYHILKIKIYNKINYK